MTFLLLMRANKCARDLFLVWLAYNISPLFLYPIGTLGPNGVPQWRLGVSPKFGSPPYGHLGSMRGGLLNKGMVKATSNGSMIHPYIKLIGRHIYTVYSALINLPLPECSQYHHASGRLWPNLRGSQYLPPNILFFSSSKGTSWKYYTHTLQRGYLASSFLQSLQYHQIRSSTRCAFKSLCQW